VIIDAVEKVKNGISICPAWLKYVKDVLQKEKEKKKLKRRNYM